MKKQKKVYRYVRSDGRVLKARREISYEIKLSSRLLLDELCFSWNKSRYKDAIDHSIDTNNKELFLELSKKYPFYIK